MIVETSIQVYVFTEAKSVPSNDELFFILLIVIFVIVQWVKNALALLYLVTLMQNWKNSAKFLLRFFSQESS